MTVLNTYINDWNVALSVIVAVIISAIVCFCCLGILAVAGEDHKVNSGVVFASVVSSCVVLASLLSSGFKTRNEGLRPHIEAIISEEMPFEEIYENYEVVDKRGDIYVLVEKEKMDE